MAQIVPNFVRTSLRAPIGVSDTQLQLASGTGVLFNSVGSGNWCYVTINDNTTAEIVKYTSTGDVVNDTIVVERAQDGTSAKAFPAGACVAVGWNTQQVEDLIGTAITNPVNTIEVTFPIGAPGPNILYAINTETGQLWYWDGSNWIYINSSTVQLLTEVPTDAPEGAVVWTINTVTSSLYYWTGLGWLLVSGQGSNYREILGRQYLTIGPGTAIAAGTDNPFSTLVTNGLPIVTNINYKSDPSIANVIEVQSTNVLKFLQPCIAEFSASVFGEMDDLTHDFRGQLSVFHANDTYQWITQIYVPANSGSATIAISMNSGPVQILANDEFDANMVVIDGGVTFVGFNMKQLQFTASVIALL